MSLRGSPPRLQEDNAGARTSRTPASAESLRLARLFFRRRLQFRAEAFNAFNRVQFGNPNANINSSAFGVISSQQNMPRNLQLGLRVLF